MTFGSDSAINLFDIVAGTTKNVGNQYYPNRSCCHIAIPHTRTHGPRIFEFPRIIHTHMHGDRTIVYFDIDHHEWVSTGTVIPVRDIIGVARLTDTEVVIYGNDVCFNGTGNRCLLFNTDTHKMTDLPDTIVCRVLPALPAIVHFRGRVVVIGGYNDKSMGVENCEQYTPGAVAWEPMPNIPTKVGCARAAVVDDNIYVIMGLYAGSVYMYDGATWHDIGIVWGSFSRLDCKLFNYKGTPAILCNDGLIRTLDTETGTWNTLDGITTPPSGALMSYQSELCTF